MSGVGDALYGVRDKREMLMREKVLFTEKSKATQKQGHTVSGVSISFPERKVPALDYSVVLPLLPEIPSFLNLSCALKLSLNIPGGHILSGYLLS